MNFTPVVLRNLEPDPKALKLMRALESIGYEDVTLFGGALRDHYLGRTDAINDYDFFLHFGTSLSEADFSRYRHLEHHRHLETLPGMKVRTGRSKPFRLGRDGKEAWTAIKFQADDARCDIFMTNRRYRLEDLAMRGDAPINSIAMNSAGHILCHPLFERHAESMIYQPCAQQLEARVWARYDHLRQKYPDLRFQIDPKGYLLHHISAFGYLREGHQQRGVLLKPRLERVHNI